MNNFSTVTVREVSVTIPTYRVEQPEKSPLFIEKRAYQGSTGKVYPLPVTEKIADVKEDVAYNAVILENEYLEVMILPELGGRIQRAYDKTNGYDFVYYNHVIKPALVGLNGPWISGGIEFNWPQHHRPTTYSAVDYSYSQNKDGSCTINVGEIDPMYGTKGMASITLYPDKSYIEIKGQLYNPTDFPQTFLWWANPAVPVNDNTFSVFPPDVNAVMDHGKRAVSTFPIATGEYYKCDYSAGVDISRYKNVPVPTSYMAAKSDFDFVGNYDEGIGAGLIHIADHHVSPGKKQWTWGNGDFGRTWDNNLTDEDGPYIELMTGVFADNQPDFTWLKPHEEKTFVQYFMPYKGVGRVANATKKAVVGVDFATPENSVLKIYVTSTYKNATIKVTNDNQTCYEKQIDLSPKSCFVDYFDATSKPENCIITVHDEQGTCLVQYNVYVPKPQPIPDPADPLLAPQDLKSTEELYLAATHLEQYRHATFLPSDYYLEGLRRDGSDIRLNNGYGLFLLKNGQIEESVKYFKKAIEKLTWKTPNPYSGETFFNIGLAYKKLGEYDKAYDSFFKATWSYEVQGVGFYHLACLATRKHAYDDALGFVEKALLNNWHNMKARTLKSALLRKLGMDNSAWLSDSHNIDPLNMGISYEMACAKSEFNDFVSLMRTPVFNYLKLAQDYMDAGLFEKVRHILNLCENKTPMVYYYIGYSYYLEGKMELAKESFAQAELCDSTYCFPNSVDEMLMLQSAIKCLEKAPMTHYYIGSLLYDKKQYETAIYHWEQSVSENDSFAMAHRNLSIAYYNKQQDGEKAWNSIQKACELEPTYTRHLLERDQLASKLNHSVAERLEVLRNNPLVKERDNLYLSYISLLNCNGEHQEALDCLNNHIFHPWEGGEGKVSSQYCFALTELAKAKIEEKDYQSALELLTKALTYPKNLGEGKLPNVPDNEYHYWMGVCYKAMNNAEKATEYFTLATMGDSTPVRVLYYNDQPSDYIYYQGLAYLALGEDALAKKAFHQLISFGERHMFDVMEYDFFAVSLPELEVYQEDIQKRNAIYCDYLRALGSLGLDKKDEAKELFEKILSVECNYIGAISQL